MLQRGHSFLLRVGSNVTLLTGLGYDFEPRDGLVYLWPKNFRNLPPLVLRLLVLKRGKQTIYRRTMMSRTPETCLLESQGTMLSLWLPGLLCVQEQLRNQGNPRRWSTAQARDAVRCALRRPLRLCRHRFLAGQLRDAVHDSHVRLRSKDSRNYPRKKREKPPGPPKIKPATPHQILVATQLRHLLAPAA